MQPNEYQKLVIHTENQDYTGIRIRLTSSIPYVRMLHAAMGMCTEVGEIQDILKKYFFYGKTIDILHLKEEIGDKLWYCGLMCDVLNSLLEKGSMEDVMEANIKKLAMRYPDKFTEWEALNRDLEKEKDALA